MPKNNAYVKEILCTGVFIKGLKQNESKKVMHSLYEI